MDYRYIKLGDCLSLITNGFVVKQSRDIDKAGGYPFTRIETLSNGRFNRDRMGYADIYDLKGLESYVLEDEDIIISHINSRRFLGRSVLYKKIGDEIILHGMNVLRIKTNRDVLNPVYANYFFQTEYYKQCIDNIRKDAINQSSFSIGDFQKLVIPLPEIEYQEKIADVLSSLDRKIALNRAINRNLEAFAKQLYDYWFVQFDFPDETGRPYKSSGGKMVWNEVLKREVPLIWNQDKLGNIVLLLKDGTHNPPARIESGVPLLTGTMFGNNFLDYSKATYISKDDYEVIHSQYQPQKGDVIITKIGTLGNVNYLRDNDLPLAIHCNSALLRFPMEWGKVYPFYSCKSSLFKARLKAVKGQSIQEFASLERIASIPMEMPSVDIINKFNLILCPLFKEQMTLANQTEALIKKRDELLPLLMNGQVEVKQLNSDLSAR